MPNISAPEIRLVIATRLRAVEDALQGVAKAVSANDYAVALAAVDAAIADLRTATKWVP